MEENARRNEEGWKVLMEKFNVNTAFNKKYKTPEHIQEKKSKMVDELLSNGRVRQVIDELNITMEEIYNNLGLFIRLLESYEECAKCTKEKCTFAREGMIPYLVRDEFDELNIKYTLCDIAKDRRLVNLNYLYKDFDILFEDITFLTLDPTSVCSSKEAAISNARISKEIFNIARNDIGRDSNFILFGKRGSGKTGYTAALTNYLVRDNHKCAHVDLRKLMNLLIAKISMKENDSYNSTLAILNDVEVLVIDNLGDEKITDWSRNLLSDILSNRNRSDKMTVITTSHSYDDLRSLYSAIKGDNNYKANKIKSDDLINQIKSLAKKEFVLRND